MRPHFPVFKYMTKRDRRINKRGGEACTSRFRAATDCRVSDGPNHRDLISPQRNKQTLVSGIAVFFFYAKRPLNARPAVWVDCWKASLRSADNPSGADLGAIYSPRPNEEATESTPGVTPPTFPPTVRVVYFANLDIVAARAANGACRSSKSLSGSDHAVGRHAA
jgi:hypothetical protein